MFGNAFSGWHLIIILAIILLLFGAPKLPALAKSIAQSMRIFKNEVGSDKRDTDEDVDGPSTRRSDDSVRRPSSDDSYPAPRRDVPPSS